MSEEEVFWALSTLVEEILPGYYTPGIHPPIFSFKENCNPLLTYIHRYVGVDNRPASVRGIVEQTFLGIESSSEEDGVPSRPHHLPLVPLSVHRLSSF